jgi:SNF2 family DNA or RNA helicase
LIKHFNNASSKTKVLLVSTRTCYEGIKNFVASRVIFLEVMWNPSVKKQAINYAYRQARVRENCLHLPLQERAIVKVDVLLQKHKW